MNTDAADRAVRPQICPASTVFMDSGLFAPRSPGKTARFRYPIPCAVLAGVAVVKRREQVAERILVVAKARIVIRHRHGQVLGEAPLDEAGALQFLQARQVVDAVQPEMVEEGGRRAKGHRPPRRAAPG